jgi:hypothetical protein
MGMLMMGYCASELTLVSPEWPSSARTQGGGGDAGVTCSLGNRSSQTVQKEQMPVTRDSTAEERDLACVMEVHKRVMGKRAQVNAEDGGEARRSGMLVVQRG